MYIKSGDEDVWWADPAGLIQPWVMIRMTMMLMRMLTVIIGMRMHEYDNEDDAGAC